MDKEEFMRQYGVSGMSEDKIRLANAAWDDATKAAREACAKICDAKADAMWAWWAARADPIDQGCAQVSEELAEEIRWREGKL